MNEVYLDKRGRHFDTRVKITKLWFFLHFVLKNLPLIDAIVNAIYQCKQINISDLITRIKLGKTAITRPYWYLLPGKPLEESNSPVMSVNKRMQTRTADYAIYINNVNIQRLGKGVNEIHPKSSHIYCIINTEYSQRKIVVLCNIKILGFPFHH